MWTGASLLSDSIEIQSSKGPYTAGFFSAPEECFKDIPANSFLIVDTNVYSLYPNCFSGFNLLLINADENSKSLHELTPLVESLLQKGLRRGDRLVGVGGGITQDITAFLASTLFRGLEWSFVPTTLLAQADSCIGSKSSINVGRFKNLMGTFNPPAEIKIAPAFLKTLKEEDIHSGIGEIIKVHMIDSPEAFLELEKDFSRLLTDFDLLKAYIAKSLRIKKKIIEVDEFDRNVRNILNYGHSFGHAIESATDFAVPHGIAVTIGMDMANYVSARMNFWSEAEFQQYHALLRRNSLRFFEHPVRIEKFIAAIATDKKNAKDHLNLILPKTGGKLEKTAVVNDERFKEICGEYFNFVRLGDL